MIRVARQRLVLDSLHLIGVGDGRIAVGLAVHGSVRGVLYAVGHPAYDTATAELYMPDLEYDVGTRDLLTGTLAWLAGRPDRGVPPNPGADQARAGARGRA